MIKQVQMKVKGMQKDLSESAFNPEFSFHNMNVRITSREKNTLLSITNEKGNKIIPIIDEDNSTINLQGLTLGYAILNNYLILFNKSNNDKPDYIYKLWFDNDNLKCKILYNGNLNFNEYHPIETLSVYENENIQKVYWLDGINQTRFININLNDENLNRLNDNSFDFVQIINLKENINIEKNLSGGGKFPSGVIQYAFTYYNNYGQESNIFYVSPLYYTSYNNRGASPEDNINNSFNIEITNIDTRFDYIRVYSILRSSNNSTPTVKNIIDLPIGYDSNSIISYTDNGTTGNIIDPTLLLYVGGEDIIAQTMIHKDNTLFLGNLRLNRSIINENIKLKLKNSNVYFTHKPIDEEIYNGLYPYVNQLNNNSQKIKTFKWNEWYRFGFIAQHKTGKWSEVVYLNDVKNNIRPNSNITNNSVSKAIYNLNDTSIINELISDGYVKIKPVVVYPSVNDREIIAQGIVCPTLFNIQDRYSNSPFAISSWYARPELQYDIDMSTWTIPYEDSKKGIVTNNTTDLSGYTVDNINKGSWVEFRHNRTLPSHKEKNCEIQVNTIPLTNPYINLSSINDINSLVSKHANEFMVDKSILTFHSPDIEFDDNIKNSDLSNIKMRIVGTVPLTSSAGDIDITTLTPTEGDGAIGFYKESFGTQNLSRHGLKALVSAPFWFDKIPDIEVIAGAAYVVYPWHANRPLNSKGPAEYRSAMLDKKKMSNLRFSYNSFYMSTPWEAYRENNGLYNGITDVSIFDSNEINNIRIKAPKNSGLNDINYQGNFDKLITYSREIANDYNLDGYEIIIAGNKIDGIFNKIKEHDRFIRNYGTIPTFSDKVGTEPVRIKFKSTPHAVFAFNYTNDNKQMVLPTFWEYNDNQTSRWAANPIYTPDSSTYLFWNKNKIHNGVFQDIIDIPTKDYGFLYLAELYNDNIINRFGGNSNEAIENNIWLSCGEAKSLLDNNNNPNTSVSIEYIEGDTFFQRYDCLKTYPFTQEDQNQMVDIISFKCETHINIDGRYDRNRGQINNLSMTPLNFNLLNDVYTQQDNFFNYKSLNNKKFNINNFPNTITWTKTKTMGELIDTWTNITLASVLDVDGDKGKINSLKNYNNELFGFQDSGIFNILFNSRTQLSTTSGIPIEIANSGKVDGKRYLSDKVGTTNKWSITQTPLGLYFIDTISKVIYLFNGNLNNLSDNLGFHSWCNNNINNLDIWNPKDYNSFTSHYDKEHKDIYFINKDICLSYSELLGQFTSFFNYEKIPFIFNLNNKCISIYNNNYSTLWEQNKGRYNEFYGSFKPYSITWLVNPEANIEKRFTNIEFRADRWLNDTDELISNKTFDTLKVWNEYQEGESRIQFNRVLPSNLKKKFRIWRANIPRNQNKMGDAIRNTWIYLKLENQDINYDRNILHDLMVNYIP